MAVLDARTDSTQGKTSKRVRGKPMSENQLTAFIGRKVYQAMNDEDGDLSDTRQEIFNRYNGELYGNERDGYSKFVTREVLETVEWVLPSVLRVFLGSNNVVSFDPVSEEDEDQAEQETDIANYAIMKSNGGDGFLALHHWCKDALTNPNGYIKVEVKEEERVEEQRYRDIDIIALQDLVDDENVEILEQDSEVVEVPSIDPMSGQEQPALMELFTIRIRRTIKEKKLSLLPIPPEEMLIDNDCTSTNCDTSDFVCHRVQKSYTELVNEGYDPDLLDDVGDGEDYQYNDERVNRLFYEDEDPDAEDEEDHSMRTFWVHDCYTWVDYDGDGIGEFRHVIVIGRTVFLNEPCDFQPAVAMSSILMPHKHNGMSVAQIIMDLQELTTTLTRQMLDNIYKFNVGRKYVSEDMLTQDGSTIEAMLNTQAEIVPVRGIPQQGVMEETRTSIVGEILPVLQHIGEQKQTRTGIAPNLTLDPEVLQQSTMGAFVGALDQASQRIEMLVRIFAETGWKQLFRKVHQLIKQNPDIVSTVKLRGKWVNDADPEGWRDRTSVTVNVGLGFNNKQQMIALLTNILGMQREAMGAGLADVEKLYNTLEAIIETADMGEAGKFFNNPSDPNFKPPEPQPDPQTILATAQAKALEAEQLRKSQEMQIRMQTEGAKAQREDARSRMDGRKSELDTQIKLRELNIREQELATKRAELEATLRAEARSREADVALTEADTTYKRAQAMKAVAETEKTAAEAHKMNVETSDEVQVAREIIENESERAEGEDSEGGEEGGEPAESQ